MKMTEWEKATEERRKRLQSLLSSARVAHGKREKESREQWLQNRIKSAEDAVRFYTPIFPGIKRELGSGYMIDLHGLRFEPIQDGFNADKTPHYSLQYLGPGGSTAGNVYDLASLGRLAKALDL